MIPLSSKALYELAVDITIAWLQAQGNAASSAVHVANAEQVAEFYKTVFKALNDSLRDG